MKKFELSEIHLAEQKKEIKLVNRLDIFGLPCYFEFSPQDWMDYVMSFTDQTDLVLFDCMLDGDFVSIYESEILPLRKNAQFERFRAQGFDPFGELIKEIKNRGMKCYLTNRISEVDVDNDDINASPLQKEHPEWFFTPSWGGSNFRLLNFAEKGVHEHKCSVLLELLRKYPFDGLDIDFERHTPYMPGDNAWEMRENVTDFLRMLREGTLQIEKETGRAIMLTARVPDCLEGCKIDGLDVWQWKEENLIDSLTLGSRSFDVQIEEFRDALGEDIKLFPCYDAHHSVDGYQHPTDETIRGVMYNWWQRGADGVEVFNWYCTDKDKLQEKLTRYNIPAVGRYAFYPVLFNEDDTGLGDKEFLRSCDKTYVVDLKGGYPWAKGYGNLNATRQLPMQIEKEGVVRLFVGENLASAKNATLRLSFSEFETETPVVYLNGKELKLDRREAFNDVRLAADKADDGATSGFGVARRFFDKNYQGKKCTDLYFDITGTETEVAYQEIKVLAKNELTLYKVEIMSKVK